MTQKGHHAKCLHDLKDRKMVQAKNKAVHLTWTLSG